MKIFLVNVNDCLNLSQYEPFFYEHIQKGQLTMLDEITDTCNLDKTYKQILAQINQQPFAFDEAMVILLIPRNFSKPLNPQSFELYNDINIYMQLDLPLRNNFRFLTIYVDKTGELELNDSVYNQLQSVYDNMGSADGKMKTHFPDLLHQIPQSGDYRDFLREKIAPLAPCTKAFFEHILTEMPEFPDATENQIRNAIHHFIGQAKSTLSNSGHAYAPIIRNDISEDICAKLRVIYYIKGLTKDEVSFDSIPTFKNDDPDYEHIRNLLATYRTRLSTWYGEPCPLSRVGTCTRKHFSIKTSANSDFCKEVDTLIEDELSGINIKTAGKISVVDAVFDKLDLIIADVREKLEIFAGKEAKELYDSSNYHEDAEETFALDEPPTEDELEERRQLEKLSRYSLHNLPDFSDENWLVQKLDIINDQIDQIFSRLQVYSIRSFLITFLFGVLTVMVLYFGAQHSVFLKENTWWVFGGYLLLTGIGFSIGYTTVKKRYIREINALLSECLDLVKKYLNAFKEIAKEFEINLKEAGNYRCLKERLDKKAAERAAFEDAMARYSWHKMRTDQILKNLRFFEHFIQDATPYPEKVTLDSYDHDVEHTEFYQLKQF